MSNVFDLLARLTEAKFTRTYQVQKSSQQNIIESRCVFYYYLN